MGDRDNNGRLQPGHGGLKKKGSISKTSSEIKELIQKMVQWINHPERFDKMMWDVYTNDPKVLIAFLAKVAPKDINLNEGTSEENPVLTQVTKIREAIESKGKVIEVKSDTK